VWLFLHAVRYKSDGGEREGKEKKEKKKREEEREKRREKIISLNLNTH
jgi:hypothetical protein